MKKTMLFMLVLVLAACTAPAVPESTPTKIIPLTETVVDISTTTPTNVPTETLVPPTPTVDLAHLPTGTPQPPATCPTIDEKARLRLGPVFKAKNVPYHDARTVVLNYLNEGGDPKTAVEKLAEKNVYVSLLDLTHDGVFEIILPSGYLTVFGCQDGTYVTLLDIPPSNSAMTAVPLIVRDLNLNGVLELFIGQVHSRDMATYQILEWDGAKFISIAPKEFLNNETDLYIKNQMIYAIGQSNAEKGALDGNWEITDTDGNGLKDIIIRAGVYDNFVSSSSLENSLILRWDGKSYIVGKLLIEATPTFTPTSTPLPFSATCSIKVPELRFQNPERNKLDKAILDYLNTGGLPEKLDPRKYGVTIKELNNDTAPEIIVIDYGFPDLMMFTCQNGRYIEAVTHEIQGDFFVSSVDILAIKDNNQNGFPEVFVEAIGCDASRCGGLYVIEWDGDQFAQKIKDFNSSGEPMIYADISEPNDAYLNDLDGDGIAELVWTGELSPDWSAERWEFYPQRLATHAYKWSGTNYTAQVVEYAAPKFRFQAVQDGDRYSKAGFYDKALQSYQLAITNDGLKWWTKDLYNYTIAPYGFGPCAENVSACPFPVEDPNERPILKAYALFKKMLVHFLMNDATKAEAAYQNLLTAHPPQTPGHKITGMATTFWNEYQSSQDIAKACAQSVAFIKTQSNVLVYLMGGYNDFQGMMYENHLREICPFTK